MNIGERIKKLRKLLDLTQQKFGERIGIKGNTVAQYELERSNPVDSVVSLICREFNVREEWLRTGEGEMFKPKPSDILDELASKYKLFNFDYAMIEKFIALPPNIRRAAYDYICDVAAALADDDPYAPFGDTEDGRLLPAEPSVEELEAEYKKSASNSAQKTDFTALNTTNGGGAAKNA